MRLVSRAIRSSIIVVLLGGTASVLPVRAVDYNDTNPAATPCGDNSHEIHTWQGAYVVSAAGNIIAAVQVMRSDFCNTVWARVTNLSGFGPGYISARNLSVTEFLTTYNCPYANCVTHTASDTDTCSRTERIPTKDGRTNLS